MPFPTPSVNTISTGDTLQQAFAKVNTHFQDASQHTSSGSSGTPGGGDIYLGNLQTNGTGDQSGAIQASLDAVVASGVRRRVVLPPGTLRMVSPIRVDASFVSLSGSPTTLDFSPLSSGSALTIGGSVNPPYTQSVNEFRNLEIKGNGEGGSVIGMRFEQGISSGNGPSHLNLYGLNIHAFAIGVSLYSRSYCNNFYGTDIYDCGVCIDDPSGGTDYGERHTFSGCTIYNSSVAVQGRGAGFFFTNCSFDYNGKHLYAFGSRMMCFGCHFETRRSGTAPYLMEALAGTGNIAIFGSKILQIGSDAPSARAYGSIVANPGQGGILLNGCQIEGVRTQSNQFITGTAGANLLRDCWTYNVAPTLMQQ